MLDVLFQRLLKMSTSFEPIIGLEVHAQISTKTKLFCSCSNESFSKEPNTNVCPICMGFPGMLPVPNKEAIEKGIKAALALNCEIPKLSKFDRKNYFYPDLPLGFQISQFGEPVSLKGYLEIQLGAKNRRIGITRLHLENDAGKLTHTVLGTLLDYNRAGAPLMEIVSEPEIRSAKEAKTYAETLQKVLRYSGSSDCDMEKGMMRFDASVSIREKGDKNLNARAEIKNLNSFRSLEAAIEYEIKRQIDLWEKGTPLSENQTVGWNAEKGVTWVMREKESASDYRYFPEPDIPPLETEEKNVKAWRKELAESPQEKFYRFKKNYGLTESEAKFYTDNPDLALFFDKVAKESKDPKATNSFIGSILVSRLRESNTELRESKITEEHLIELIKGVRCGKISNNVAKTTVFDEMMLTGKYPNEIIKEKSLTQMSDTSQIEALCLSAIEANPGAVSDIKSGKMKAIGILVGTVMKESKGKANPKLVNDILIKLLI